jgi:hypothetical protein
VPKRIYQTNCGLGMTGSYPVSGVTGSVGSIGITGPIGRPVPGLTPRKITVLCLNDCGFFKAGQYYDVRITLNYLQSTDGLSLINILDIGENIIWGDKLREYKLSEILNETISRS